MDEIRVPILAESDVLTARQQGRRLANELGFSGSDLAVIATAISEIARNVVQHAARGEMVLSSARAGPREGIVVVSSDEGPGIGDVAIALQDGYSTGGGLGLGLPGARRLMDEFEVVSRPGHGITITMKKWKS
jgi:serine/threonine-protein kinase RsbT